MSPQARRRPALASSSRAYRTAQCATGAPHASHAAPTHTHAHHDTPARRDAAGPSARRRLALASGPRADRPARCAAHHARRTLCAVRFARRPIRNITRRLLITRALTQPQRPASRDAADSPAHRRLTLASGSRAHRTAQCVAHNAHNTLRATLRAQHISRFRSPPRTRATTPRRHAATQRAAQPAAASHSPSAHVPTAPHPAQHVAHAALCAPRFARHTVRASLHTHAPDRTVTVPHGARHTLRTQHVVRRPIRHRPHRSIARRLLITRAHALPRAPRRAATQWAPASRRLAFGSESRVDRSAQRATRQTRSTWRAFPTHTHTQRSPSATSQRSPSATQPQAPRRAATRRAPQPAAVSRSLPARAPTAPPGAQHANAPHVVRLSLRNRPHRNIARRPLIPRAHTQPERCANRDAASSPTRRRLAPASSSHSGRTAQCAAPPHAHVAPHARARHLERHPLTTHTHAQPHCAGAP